ADGRVLTGKRACELGFVDELGNYEDAVDATAKLAGITGTPRVHLDAPSNIGQFLDSLTSLSIFSRTPLGPDLEYKAF
ncbi:MAG TPA: S49 family peptidase, partial [bacterium]|nr:S49 family peptidase [bacterium]